ncbi:MAG: hypothetical protein JWO80_1401, partial [Bryobacterales bacterium]|nr:hypothetical protein [Bryobacterales bacterium]
MLRGTRYSPITSAALVSTSSVEPDRFHSITGVYSRRVLVLPCVKIVKLTHEYVRIVRTDLAHSMRNIFLLVFSLGVLRGFGTVTVDNVSTTATQAVILYTAPDPSPCIVELSESPSYTPLVPDLDPAKFAGANLDSRAGSVSHGTSRIFVAGRRAAEVGLDGVRYSRALQTATQHYFRITCGDQVATGTLSTMSVPFGMTYVEPPLGDPNQPGQYAYPTLSTTDRTQAVIDPQTGVKITRLTMGIDTIIGGGVTKPAVVRGGAWAGASNLTSSGSATVAKSTGKMFMGLSTLPTAQMVNEAAAYGPQPAAYGYYQLNLTIGCNVGGSSAANPADCAYSTCITVDGVNCYTGSNIYSAVAGRTAAVSTFGTTNTIDLWQTPGAKVPDFRDQGNYFSTATCDGSTTVTRTGGDHWSTNWGPGSHINIKGTDYAIAKVINNQTLVLTTACTAGGNVAAENFGVLVWKNTASADVLTVTSATINWRTNFYFNSGVGGGYEYASPLTITGSNGNPGFNFHEYGNNYWLDDVTGEGHLRGQAYTTTGCGDAFNGQFYAFDADTHVCGNGSGGIFLVKYYQAFDGPPGTIFGEVHECNTSGGNVPPYTSQQPCTITTPLTPGTDIKTLAVNFTNNPAYAPQFDPSYFNGISLTGSDGLGNVLIQAAESTVGQGGSLGWLILFNPTANSNSERGTSSGAVGNHGCVGGGHPGCVVAAMPSWSRPNCRWCPVKGSNFATDGWPILQPYAAWLNNSRGTGPYTVPV